MQSLASDNNSGAHPEVVAAMLAANVGHAAAYGDDEWTGRATELARARFGAGATVGFAFNGTGANVVGLQLLLKPWGHVLAPATAHIGVDECGALERLCGAKLVTVVTIDGKLRPGDVVEAHRGVGNVHSTQPCVVSIAQATECGTSYTAEEVRALAETTHALGMTLHMDGCRLANAAAHLGTPLGALTLEAGVDVCSFGGTKNGAVFGEMIVARADLAEPLGFLTKQLAQLGSKQRFVAAQFEALLTDDLWLRNARHANSMATRLAEGSTPSTASAAHTGSRPTRCSPASPPPPSPRCRHTRRSTCGTRPGRWYAS
ncbi:MAG: beta-eliminating lyase-related protein [Microthrixaceae bacterium]